VFPWIPFLSGGRKRLSDIEYLSIKEFGGKRVDAVDEITTASSSDVDLVSVTTNSGKDTYLASATVEMSMLAGSVNNQKQILTLLNNGSVVETQIVFIDSVDGTNNTLMKVEFKKIGEKILESDVVKIVVNQGAAKSCIFNSRLIMFEETTGESPAIT